MSPAPLINHQQMELELASPCLELFSYGAGGDRLPDDAETADGDTQQFLLVAAIGVT